MARYARYLCGSFDAVLLKTHHLLWIALLATLVQFPTTAPAQEFSYELSPGDQVRVTVFREADMSGEFRVDDSGILSVPGIGDVHTNGRTVSDLRKALVKALEAKHFANPDVVVQMVQYAPVFVVGDVRNPGRYNFAPGMTARQLVAIAGGYGAQTAASADSLYLLREQSRYREDLMVARERFSALAVRRARLFAERDSKQDFDVPNWLEKHVGRDRLDQIVATESNLLRIRLDEPATRSNLLRKQRGEIENEIEALEAQLVSVRQLKITVDAELKAIKQLRQQGIVANARVMELERLAVDTDLRINSTLATISQTQQDRTTVDLQLQKLDEDLRVRIAESLADTETELAIQSRRIAASTEFLGLTGGEASTERSGAQAHFDRTFIVARAGRDQTEVVTGGAPVRPGDILTVVRESPAPPLASISQSAPVSADINLTGVRR
jgi:polysaccharide export outer membrane protein